jgi:hypothetical protein
MLTLDEQKAKKKEYDQKRYYANIEKERERTKNYYHNNIDSERQRSRTYYMNNIEKERERKKIYREKKKIEKIQNTSITSEVTP